MMVNPTSLTVGDRALIKELFISKNSDNPAYYDNINEELYADHKLFMSSMNIRLTYFILNTKTSQESIYRDMVCYRFFPTCYINLLYNNIITYTISKSNL